MNNNTKEAKSMRVVFIKIIGVSLIPLIVMGVAITIITNISFRSMLESEIKRELRTAAYVLSENYNMLDPGDYEKKEDGMIYKGDHKVTGNLGRIGEELLKSGLVCTFFYGDTRIDTTVVDLAGNNMAGTKLDVNIYKKLHEKGEELFCESANLGNRIYYGYYIPCRNTDGEVTAIFFAGRLQSEVFALIQRVSSMIIWIGLVVMILGSIVSLLCTIYIVGFVFKHFRNEENSNIQKSVAKEQMEFMNLVNRELRDPIDTVTVLSDRILEDDVSPRTREDALGIKEANNSMMTALNTIYDYSSLELGENETESEEYELTKLVRRCCNKGISEPAKRRIVLG